MDLMDRVDRVDWVDWVDWVRYPSYDGLLVPALALFQTGAGHAFANAAVLQEIPFLSLDQPREKAKSHIDEDNRRIGSKVVGPELLVYSYPADDFLC